VRAINAGERDPLVLARLRDRRIRANEAEVAASLQGHWREEHLFSLKQALALIDAYAEQISGCDAELARLLAALKDHEPPEQGLGAPKRKTPARNAVGFDARQALLEASGVDLTRIPGIDTSTALKVISEVGMDLSRFPTVKHFTSWMSLCPGTKISGGKVLSAATKAGSNCAAQALRMAAQALRKSQSTLGAYHRRLCARMDRPKAIIATAHKLARLICFMLSADTGRPVGGLQGDQGAGLRAGGAGGLRGNAPTARATKPDESRPPPRLRTHPSATRVHMKTKGSLAVKTRQGKFLEWPHDTPVL
jgi:transposase